MARWKDAEGREWTDGRETIVWPPEDEAQPVIGWELWYDVDRTFSDKDGPWADAPADGVQVFVVYVEPEPWRSLASGYDGYLLRGESPSSVKRGSRIPDAVFAAVLHQALTED